MTVQSISAVTLAVRDMGRAVEFYHVKVGLEMLYGGADAGFTSFRVAGSYLNLIRDAAHTPCWWGRLILYIDDVDAMYRRLVDAGLKPDDPPADAPWHERYFHISDPDGHELSFAKPLS